MFIQAISNMEVAPGLVNDSSFDFKIKSLNDGGLEFSNIEKQPLIDYGNNRENCRAM